MNLARTSTGTTVSKRFITGPDIIRRHFKRRLILALYGNGNTTSIDEPFKKGRFFVIGSAGYVDEPLHRRNGRSFQLDNRSDKPRCPHATDRKDTERKTSGPFRRTRTTASQTRNLPTGNNVGDLACRTLLPIVWPLCLRTALFYVGPVTDSD